MIETAEAVEVIETIDTVEMIETADGVDGIESIEVIDVVEEVADEAATSGSEASTLVNSADADWASDEPSVATSDDFDDDDDFAAAMAGSSSMADLVDDFQFKPLKAGEARDGIIVSISPNEIWSMLAPSRALCTSEMERLGKEYISSLSVGDSVVVYTVRPGDSEGNVVLSLARAQQEHDWREAERLQESTDAFDAPVIGYNRGGVICRVGKVRGFVHAGLSAQAERVNVRRRCEPSSAGTCGSRSWSWIASAIA